MSDELSLLVKIYESTEKTREEISHIKEVQAEQHSVMIKQQIILDDHVSRQTATENLIETIREKDIEPVKRHVIMVEGVCKFFGGLTLLAGLAASVVKILEHFF